MGLHTKIRIDEVVKVRVPVRLQQENLELRANPSGRGHVVYAFVAAPFIFFSAIHPCIFSFIFFNPFYKPIIYPTTLFFWEEKSKFSNALRTIAKSKTNNDLILEDIVFEGTLCCSDKSPGFVTKSSSIQKKQKTFKVTTLSVSKHQLIAPPSFSPLRTNPHLSPNLTLRYSLGFWRIVQPFKSG